MTQATAVAELEKDFGVLGQAPVRRLSAATRHLAARLLSGECGRLMGRADFTPEIPDATGPARAYALTVQAIAAHAPVRVLDGERIVGAATLFEATNHQTPASEFGSTSHTTIGFDRVLREGYAGIRDRIDQRLARGGLDGARVDFLESMRLCLDAAGTWHARYLEAVRRRGMNDVARILERVPEQPAADFREAVQSLWFAWSFQRLCGNWSGLGRLDQMLGPYLARDLERGAIDRDGAREYLAHFWLKGCEWVGAANMHAGQTGDAQFYQNVVLGGIDRDGVEVTNEVTWLILDVVEELHISDYPIAVRMSARSPERLWRRVAEVQRRGGGIVSIYNEDVVLTALERFGYDPLEARDFANDGCWEVIIPGKTSFGYHPFDTLQILQQTLGIAGDGEAPDFPDFEALYAAWQADFAAALTAIQERIDERWTHGPPAPLLAMLVDDCIETARDYHRGGAHYRVGAPHPGGLPDTANSLLAIRKLVYEDRELTLPELVRILRADWAGHEDLRQRLRRDLVCYGNGDEQADAMLVRLFDDFTALAAETRDRAGVLRPPGISTFGREIGWRDQRLASAHGHHAGDILATNLAPTPGSDRHGPTAVIGSFCKMDYTKLPNGVPLELKLLPSSVRGEEGLTALISLLKSFVELGGFYLHVDVVDSETLRDAQRHPERYPNLVVRISGWSARFATLSKPWQDMIIQRTQQLG